MTQYISWSALRTWSECRQRNMLNKSGRRAPMHNQRVFFPGTVVDRVVRDWLEEDPYNNMGMMPEMVESTVIREKGIIEEGGGVMLWKDGQDHSQTIKDCIEAVQKIEPALVEKVLPYDYQADFKFRAPLSLPHPSGDMEVVVLNGAIDILVYDPKTDSWKIYDVKMTRDNGYWRKTMGQLGFYDLANIVLFGKYSSEVALLQPLCDERVKDIPLSDHTRSVMMQQVSLMATEVWLGNNEPRKDNKYCGFCDVKHACSKFQPTVVNGKKKISFNLNR